MSDDLEKRWDRADFAAAAAWAEMDAFLKEIEALGPTTDEQERQRRNARFLEIQARCNERVVETTEQKAAIPHHI